MMIRMGKLKILPALKCPCISSEDSLGACFIPVCPTITSKVCISFPPIVFISPVSSRSKYHFSGIVHEFSDLAVFCDNTQKGET